MAPILNIDTLIVRPQVQIDGELYEIAAPDELSLVASQQVAAHGRTLDRLMKADTLSHAEALQLRAMLGSIAAIVMAPVPFEIRVKLSDAQLMSVIEVFTMLSLARKTRLAGAALGSMVPAVPAKPTRSAGERQSPASSTATAATPSAG